MSSMRRHPNQTPRQKWSILRLLQLPKMQIHYQQFIIALPVGVLLLKNVVKYLIYVLKNVSLPIKCHKYY